jgi:histidinol-phosphatase
MNNLTDDLAFAHRLADLAEAIASRHFAAGNTTWRSKSDASPVSAADEEIERTLRRRLQQDRPDDALLGEEFGAAGHGRRRWIIDAVDGTASFLAGEPEWSTLIALEQQSRSLLGVVGAPALRRRWWAIRGAGAWTRPTGSSTRPEPLAVTGASKLRDATVGIWPPPSRLSPPDAVIAARVAAAARATRPALDWTGTTPPSGPIRKPSTGTGTCHGALLVATGQLDAFLLLGAGPWDIAALVPIIEEAGGIYHDLSSHQHTDTRSGLFTNPALHQQMVDATIRNHRL